MQPGFDSVLRRAREGDEDAWSSIYASLAPGMLGYLRANNAPEPEDICSEAMLQVARDLHRFEGDERAMRSWSLTITHHRLLDARRHRSRRPVDPVAELPESRAEFEPGVDTVVLERLGSERVADLLGALSEDQRTVVTLRIVTDLTIAEVAKAMGKREGAVKQLQRRGLAAIERRLLKEAGETDPAKA